MTNKEKMLGGYLYIANDKELAKMYKVSKQFEEEYNQTSFRDEVRRKSIIRLWFGKVKTNYNITPPIHCDYGKNIEIGENFYANYDCIFLDVCKITFGDNVFLGPRVNFFTAWHPIDAQIRNTQYEGGKPIKVGNNVWIGGGSIINPGVTIGDNVIIGSGSVVTKDLPGNAIYAGNPAKKIRDITDEDKKYWSERYENEINM